MRQNMIICDDDDVMYAANQEKTKMLIRRMNDMRRASKLEITQLKASLASLQGRAIL